MMRVRSHTPRASSTPARENPLLRALNVSRRGRTGAGSSHAPWPLGDLDDIIRGQLKASEGIDVNTIIDVISENARRISTGFEPVPAGFPPGPRGESGLLLASNPLEFLQSMFQAHGGLATVVIGGERVVLIGDPKIAKQIVEDEPQNWVKEGTAFFPGSSLAGNGLLVSDGAIWRRQRRLSNPAFRPASVRRYSQSMQACTQWMIVNRWAPTMGGVRDIYADFNQLTLDITLAAIFGQDLSRSELGQDVSDSIRQAFKHFSQRSASGFIVPEWFPSPDNLQYNAAVHRLDSFIYSLIDQRREELQTRSQLSGEVQVPGDLLEALLLATDDDGSVMEDQSLRDELMTLLVAGQETSAILMGWTVATVAWNPEVQEFAAQEIHEVLKGRPPTMDIIDLLPYCACVVLETLRMHPPAYMIGRCAATSTVLADSQYSIPKNTTALIAPYLLHYHPDRWKNPEQFDPSRWQRRDFNKGWKGALAGFGPNGSYLPFGGGPRVCIGTRFAFVEVMLVMVAVIQRFKLTPATPQSPFPLPEPLITLRPKAVQVCMHNRHYGTG